MNSITDEEKEAIQSEMRRFEIKRSAILPSLFILQKTRGFISEKVAIELASFMEIPLSQIFEVRSFYSLISEESKGKLHVRVCTNLSCAMNGGREVAKAISEKYKVDYDKVSPCEKITVSKVECLGSCDQAPVMQVNGRFYEDLKSETAIQILEGLKL